MSNTSKTIDMMQVQVQCSNANLQLLTAGREILVKTLQALQIKYLGIQKELVSKNVENTYLKKENKSLADRVAALEEVIN